MDIRDLRSRIDTIKDKAKTEPAVREDPGKILLEHGWTRLDDMVYEKLTAVKNPLPDNVSDILLSTEPGENCNGSVIPGTELIFYDTETSGLSAGAGNIVFLAGFGFTDPDSGDFRIVQLFLSDFPGEPSFLDHMKRYIRKDRVYVSYNGKSFDANVIKSRYALNGKTVEFGPQLDLLYSSRRLWKNIIGSCSLGDIERRVLDKHRALDVPGFMVPDLYFDFIKTKRFDVIEGVIAHHEEDISSLAELLAVHEQLFDEAGSKSLARSSEPTGYFDPLGLASLLMEKWPGKAVRLLRENFNMGNSRAGLTLGLYLKRKGEWTEAAAVWSALWESHRSITAAVELAKYYEHRTSETDKALEITSEILSLDRFRIKDCLQEIEKRKNRLELKIKNKAV